MLEHVKFRAHRIVTVHMNLYCFVRSTCNDASVQCVLLIAGRRTPCSPATSFIDGAVDEPAARVCQTLTLHDHVLELFD